MARMASGKLFQRRGAALENALSPSVCSLNRRTSTMSVEHSALVAVECGCVGDLHCYMKQLWNVAVWVTCIAT